MPEGHAIHRLARMIGALFDGEALAVSSPQGRFEAGAAALDGRVLLASQAYGKHLYLGFAPRPGAPVPDGTPDWLRVHLGLYGAWTFAGDGSAAVVHAIGAPRRRVGEQESAPTDPASAPDGGPWFPPPPRGAVRVRLVGAAAVADLTGPTACEVLTAPEKDASTARLGPDPLRPDADPAAFVNRARRSRVAIGQLLLDQAVVAGAGNIYRAEVLFRAGLDPFTPGRAVPVETLEAIWADLALLMADGVEVGRIVTTGDADEPHWVYRRAGLPCRVCGTPVLGKEVAARNLFWCPVCQR